MTPTTRRRFLFSGAVATGFLAFQAPVRQAHADTLGAIEGATKGPPVPDHPIKKISPHVYMIQAPDGFPTPQNQGFMANITFVVGEKGVIVVDSGASLEIGEMALRQLRTITQKPIIGIINTHYHGDHWLGNHAFINAFGTDLPLYAHKGTREAIAGNEGHLWHDAMLKWTNEASIGTKIIPPNHDVDHGATLSLGDVELRLHHYGQAHTHSDINVEVVGDGVMCVGDVLMDHRIANMEDGSYQGTFATLDSMIKNSQTHIWLPAHGNPGPEVLTWHRTLFEGIYQSCAEAVKQGIPLEGALAFALKDPRVSSCAHDTRGWDKNIGKYVSIAYLEAEQAQF